MEERPDRNRAVLAECDVEVLEPSAEAAGDRCRASSGVASRLIDFSKRGEMMSICKQTRCRSRRVKLRDLHIALVVAELGSMTWAAEELAVSRGLDPNTLRPYPAARQLKPIWQHTAALLLQAHESGKPDDLRHATAQLRRALDAEGWAA